MSMKQLGFRLNIALRISIAVLLCHLSIASTLAQGSIRADIFEQLEKAQAAQNSGDIQQTFKILDALKARSGKKALRNYELIQLNNFYAYAWLAKENYSAALNSFSALLKQKDVPAAMRQQVQFTMAQLYLATDQPQQTIKLLKQWLNTQQKPSPDAYVLMAQAQLQLTQLSAALQSMTEAFKAAKQQGREEKENWYAILQYIYNEQKDFARQEQALEVLVDRWPKAQWWLALGGAYAQQEKEQQQLYAMDAAYQQGLFDRGDYIVSMSQLLSSYGAPYYAAKALQQGLDQDLVVASFKNLQRLADYYQRAQEVDKAISAFQQAIALAPDGELSLRLAYVYMQRYEYANAVKYIRRAIELGGLRNTTQANLLLGEALFHDRQYDAAVTQFQAVQQTTRNFTDKDGKLISAKQKRYFQQASSWAGHAKNEQQRQIEMARWVKENS